MVSPSLPFPLTHFSFTGFIGDSPWAGNTLAPGATFTKVENQSPYVRAHWDCGSYARQDTGYFSKMSMV